MIYLFYNTQEDAETVQGIIFNNRLTEGLCDKKRGKALTPQVTSRWAEPIHRESDSLWAVPKPENTDWLQGILTPTVEEEWVIEYKELNLENGL